MKLQNKVFKNEEALHNAVRRGYAVLHIHTILFLLFLIVYMIVGFVVVNSLFNTSAYTIQYSIQAGIELLLWGISIGLLWNGKYAGKVMFTIVGVLALYAIYNFIGMFQYTMDDGVDKLIRAIYFIFFICKCLTSFLIMSKLFQRPIMYIWSEHEHHTKSEEAQDEQLIQQLMQCNAEQQQKVQSRKKILRRALHNLRRNAILLFMILYGSIILFYILMFVVRYLFSSDVKGMDYVQRYILLASLFTALVWSIGAILLFLYKRYAILGVYGAWILELLRFIMTMDNTIDVFQTQHYGFPSILTIIIMELLRYAMLVWFSKLLLQDPFIKVFWKKQKIRDQRKHTKT